MNELFLNLPEEYTPDLSKKAKKILVQKGEYTIPGKDAGNKEHYLLDTSSTPGYLRLERSFTSGQRAFMSFELRTFKKKDGTFFLVFSRYGGLPAAYQQQELRFFEIGSNGLTETPLNLLPKEIPLGEFLKKETPEALRKKFEKGLVNGSYDLAPSEDGSIEYRIVLQASEEEFSPWIAGYDYLFQWNGISFVKELVKD